jgi:hypothetical protein
MTLRLRRSVEEMERRIDISEKKIYENFAHVEMKEVISLFRTDQKCAI